MLGLANFWPPLVIELRGPVVETRNTEGPSILKGPMMAKSGTGQQQVCQQMQQTQ